MPALRRVATARMVNYQVNAVIDKTETEHLALKNTLTHHRKNSTKKPDTE